jgi:two-component system, OmpR family, response regulator
MPPKSLALIDDDADFARVIGEAMEQRGVPVRTFADTHALLASEHAFDFGFYVLDLMVQGSDVYDLIRQLRRRTAAGIVVATRQSGADAFCAALGAGADMFLAKPIGSDQVLQAVEAVNRRAAGSVLASIPWQFDRRAGRLVTPSGLAVELSASDLVVMDCFIEAHGASVTRADLCRRLGRELTIRNYNWLHATIYRLRRRIERATNEVLPVQSQSRVGYVFRAELADV